MKPSKHFARGLLDVLCLLFYWLCTKGQRKRKKPPEDDTGLFIA